MGLYYVLYTYQGSRYGSRIEAKSPTQAKTFVRKMYVPKARKDIKFTEVRKINTNPAKPPKGKRITCKAVKFNRNGSVSIYK